jgi:type II secretory pathway pseudopilin PulG
MSRPQRDDGMTLIELLLAASLLMVLMGVAFSTLLGVKDGAARTRTQHELNEEGRNALNRMVREIRQAKELVYVVNPDGPDYDASRLTALSLRADFNNDGCAGNTVPAPCSTDVTANPESLTYCYDPQGSAVEKTHLWLIPVELTATPTSCNIAGALPILAGNVAGFSVEYRSNQYRFDTEPPAGVTTWRELDNAIPPVGDVGGSDGDINTSAIRGVNSVVLHLRMAKDGLEQAYTTQVDVRNKP